MLGVDVAYNVALGPLIGLLSVDEHAQCVVHPGWADQSITGLHMLVGCADDPCRGWVVVKIVEDVTGRDVVGVPAERIHGALRPRSGDKRLN
ncbi:hypothetical protein L838_3192 [Mycobacterium avium MAV_120709_2344]|nr:hypothetical protein L838_3192 [Mycobacterium avium MAV_120709_2344]